MINNIKTTSTIEQKVMRRVRAARILRAILSGAAASGLLLLLALWGIGKEVWVARVLENTPRDISVVPQFYFYAFSRTEFIVQALVLLVLASAFYLAKVCVGEVRALISPTASG